MNYKLTSVKILNELYKNFKSKVVEDEFTLQKLVNRSMHLYINDDDFIIRNYSMSYVYE